MVPQTPPADTPPQRTAAPVFHRSAGRDLFAQRYVIGWPEHGLVKIGSGNGRRVKRFTSTPGAELIDIAYYAHLYDDVRSEVWLDRQAGLRWPQAFQFKHEARFLMGNNTAGWTEFRSIPVEEWPELRRLAAL